MLQKYILALLEFSDDYCQCENRKKKKNVKKKIQYLVQVKKILMCLLI